jgi:hypothetical protein
MKESSKFELQADVRFRVVADEGIIIRQTEGEVLSVNQLGGEILTLIQQNQSFGDIVAALTRQYNAESKIIFKDAQAYLEELLSSQVINIVEE